MKRMIAIICTFVLLFTMLVPTEVFALRVAAGSTGSMAGWEATGPGAKIVDGVGILTSDGSSESRIKYTGFKDAQPLKFNVSFSMRILGNTNDMGLMIIDGVCRAGFYTQTNRLMSMDTGQFIMVPNMHEWHEYSVDVDMENAIQYVTVDDVLLGSQTLGTHTWKGNFQFWCGSAGGHLEVENAVIRETADATGGGEEKLRLTNEYTEPFFQDFNTKGGWFFENTKTTTLDPEEGVVRLASGPIVGDHTSFSMHSIERPLRPPTNYDMEFRMKLSDLMSRGFQDGMTNIELSTDDRHTWLYVYRERIWHNGISLKNPEVGAAGHALQVRLHDDEWHVWKAEVRGRYITWYVDDQVLMNYQIRDPQSTDRWHFTIYTEHEANLSTEAFVDWVRYTPYFQDLEITAPMHYSEIAESKDITFKAAAPEGTEYVDYYIGDVPVGRGYAPNYEYVLKDAKVGTYEFYAKAGDLKSVKSTIFVKKAFDAELKLSKDEIKQGESVSVSLETKAISPDVAAKSVEYYVNNEKVATSNKAPFKAELSGLRTGTASIFAKVTNLEGKTIQTEEKYVNVSYVPGKELKIGREYELNYKYTSGTGKIELTDGYFKFAMTHNKDKIVYESNKGTEEYPLGAGEYKVVATAGYAEVYYNGQFAFSMFMPRSSDKIKFTNSGLKDVHLKGSGVKAELFGQEWKGEENFYAEVPETMYYSLEFDKTDASEETMCFYDGVYENEISFRSDGIYVNRQLVMGDPVTELKLSDEVKPGYYRVTVGTGLAQMFRDNEYIGSYRAPKYTHVPSIVRTMTNPSASTFIALKNTDDIFYFDEDFEGNTELSYEDYFQVRPENVKVFDLNMTQKLVTKNGNTYMQVSGTGVSMLNGIGRNPIFKFRAMVEKREGKVYFMLRRSRGDFHDKIGYDFEKNQWFFSEYTGSENITAVANDPNAFQAGKWYDFEIKFDTAKVTLLCDGKEVITGEENKNVWEVYYGRQGFGAIDGTLNIDDIYYESEDRVTPGLLVHNTNEPAKGGSVLDGLNFYKGKGNDEGKIFATVNTGEFETSDKGKTWSNQVLSNSGQQRAFAGQLVTMPDGNLLKLTVGARSVTSSISKDGGKTWGDSASVMGDYYPSRDVLASISRLTCTKDGRLFFVTSEGGEYYGYSPTFYSEDGGKSWKMSETVITTSNSGIVLNESTVVERPDGELWMLSRSDSGFLDYFVSKDGGKTWDTTVYHTGLIQCETCFKVMRDWRYDNVYYAIFIYDSESVSEYALQHSRNRASLAVSYDGMTSWEYVTDLIETNLMPGLSTSDSNLEIIDDQLFWKTTNYGNSNGVGSYFGTQEINKIKSLKRMPQLHERFFVAFTPQDDFANNHSVIPKDGGKIWVYGDYYTATVEEGRIDLENAEKIFGTHISKVGGGVELKMGDAVVKFTENSKEYTVNGETLTAENVCYKNGLVDIKTCAQLFGKVFTEKDNVYNVLYQTEAIDMYQEQVDNILE